MVSKSSGSHKLKKNTLPKFEANVYSRIPSGELIVFSVHYLIEHKTKITLENIVSICFLLFPHKFGLKNYPKWPDSALVSRRWGDSRRKGYISIKADFEYKLTSKGSSLLKKVEKVLGVAAPKPIVKVQTAKPKEDVVIPLKKAQTTASRKKTTKRVKKVRNIRTLTPKAPAVIQKKIAQLFQEEKMTLPVPVQKIRPVRAKKVSPAPAPVKQTREKVAPPLKQKKKINPVLQAKKTRAVPVSKPAAKKQPIQTIKARPIIQIKNIKPRQVKKTKPVEPEIIGPAKVEKAQPRKAVSFAPTHVTREAKERAGKFTRLMERSDAYLHYIKNGNNAKISEFDFRSLLLCTMESSPETLARNVELFKGYAGIHNRRDLIVFLAFCKDRFSYLLKPKIKAKK